MGRSALVRRPFIFDTEDTTDVLRVDVDAGHKPTLSWQPRTHSSLAPYAGETLPLSSQFSPADLRALAAMLVSAADEAEKAAVVA